jgi:2-keto-myo-inositol isomerase
MRSCFNTVTAAPYPLREQIDLMGKHGYEGTEIQSNKLDEYLQAHSMQELKDQLARNKVEAAALMAFPYFGFKEGPLGDIRKYAELAQQVGAACLLCYCCDGPPEGMSEEEGFARAGASAREYGKAAAPFGVKIALEPIGANRFVPGPAQALRIAKASGEANVGVMFDTFHSHRGGVTLQEIEEIPVEKLLIVHVNDVPDLPRETLTDAHRVYPGEGCLPLVEEFRILRKKGYRGFLSVEIFNRDYWKDTADNIIRKSKAGLDRVLAQV